MYLENDGVINMQHNKYKVSSVSFISVHHQLLLHCIMWFVDSIIIVVVVVILLELNNGEISQNYPIHICDHDPDTDTETHILLGTQDRFQERK